MNSKYAGLVALAQSAQDYVVSVRRHLHANPEVRWEETQTLAFIKAELGNLPPANLTFEEMAGGLVVDYTVDPSQDRVLFRSDVDALPVPEATGLPFASKNQDKSHACGHDTHAAMLLGAIKLIAEDNVVPTKNLRFVFQRAEENPITKSGGDSLVQEGVCDGISAAYALHIYGSPEGTSGVFQTCPNRMLGNSGRIGFKIRAKGGHVMNPSGGSNALRVANAVMNHLNGFVTRHFVPTEPATLEPTSVLAGKGGESSNVMPALVEIWYGFRTFLPREQHIEMTQALEIEVLQLVQAMGCTLECEKHYGHPALINAPEEVVTVMELLHGADQKTSPLEPKLGGEDFAHYLYKVPGCMYMLGAYQQGCGDHHTPTFNPDESVFWRGVLFWLLLATK